MLPGIGRKTEGCAKVQTSDMLYLGQLADGLQNDYSKLPHQDEA